MLNIGNLTVEELRDLDRVARETCGLEMTAQIGQNLKIISEVK